jgi:hypothetical protein
MIDYNNLFKVGEINEIAILFAEEYKRKACVYLLRFGEETYIGSTLNLFERVTQHQVNLRKGKGVCPPDLWDLLKLCEIFVLYTFTKEEIENSIPRKGSPSRKMLQEEQRFVLLLNPTLNKRTPNGKMNPFSYSEKTPFNLFEAKRDIIEARMVSQRNVVRNQADQRTNWKHWDSWDEKRTAYYERSRRAKEEREKTRKNWDENNPTIKKWREIQDKTDIATTVQGHRIYIHFLTFHEEGEK